MENDRQKMIIYYTAHNLFIGDCIQIKKIIKT